MISYKEFVDDAIRNYELLPVESNEIYKKYAVNMPLTEISQSAQPETSAHELELEEFSKGIAEKTRIKFDAVISGNGAKSINPGIRISINDKADMNILESKLFKSSEDKFAAFTNANSRYFISVDAEEGAHRKLNLLFVNSGNLPIQVLIKAGSSSKLEVFEIFISANDSGSLVSVLHEISAGKNAEVELNVLHNESRNTRILNLCKAVAGDGARLRANFMYSGGALVKAKGHADSNGINSQVDISEFALGANDQKFDLGTFIINTKPHSVARLESGAVLSDSSQCMLKGFAKVEKGAKGCLSKITERGILLSKDAHIDALPDMSIDYSNEVKATHSAATSPMDKEALFYLMSRGLEENMARKIFISAFIAKYIYNMKEGVASAVTMSVMLDKLENGSSGVMPDVTTSGVWGTK
ncbi:MAG: SufD family Fe-S cluster assembly protein [Candidatus Micrarchaeaceae archaeon]